MADCYAEAGRMCPRGYDVLGGDKEDQPFSMGSGYASGGNAGVTTYSGTLVFRNMMVRCH